MRRALERMLGLKEDGDPISGVAMLVGEDTNA